MPKFKVSRVFATKYEWTIEAKDEDEALSMLDDDDKTPDGMANETWLGHVMAIPTFLLVDDCEDVNV